MRLSRGILMMAMAIQSYPVTAKGADSVLASDRCRELDWEEQKDVAEDRPRMEHPMI